MLRKTKEFDICVEQIRDFTLLNLANAYSCGGSSGFGLCCQ